MFAKYNNNNVGYETFESVSSFINTIESRKDNKAFSGERLASQTESSYFTGTESFEEAQGILRTGYKEGLENMLKMDSNVKVCNNNKKSVREVYYYGSTPCISNVLTGQPKTMYRRQTVTKKVKTIELNYDVCLAGGIDKDVLTLGGKNIISLVKHFESQGMNVKLNIFFAVNKESGKESKMAAMTVKIKDYSQKINPLLVSYVMTHPSFFRRHCFRWIETSELTNYKSYTHGYGYVSNMIYDKDTMVKRLRENKVISKDGYYINVSEAAAANSIEELVNALGVKA